jgi:hypothetical protein
LYIYQNILYQLNESKMKKSNISPFAALLALCGILTIVSCKKSSDGNSGFTWTYRDTTYRAVSYAAYTYSIASTPIIMASLTNSIRPTSGNHVSIILASLAVGTYTIAGGIVPDGFRYINSNGDDTQTMSGSVTITAYANNQVSGSFSVGVRDMTGITRPLTGSFTNTPVEP